MLKRSPSTATEALVDMANAGGGSDNITVAIVHVEDLKQGVSFSPFGISLSPEEEIPRSAPPSKTESTAPTPKLTKAVKGIDVQETVKEKLPHGAAFWPKPTVEPKRSSGTYIKKTAPFALVYVVLIFLAISVYVSSDILLDNQQIGTSTNSTVSPLEIATDGFETPKDPNLNEKPLNAKERALLEEILLLAECRDSGNCRYSVEELEQRIESKNKELERY